MTEYRYFAGRTDFAGNLDGGLERWTALMYHDSQSTEANANLNTYSSFTAKNLEVFVVANDYDDAVACSLGENNTNTTVTVSVTANTTGSFEDTSNTNASVDGDLYNLHFTAPGAAGGSGTVFQENHGVSLSSASAIGHFLCNGFAQITSGTVEYYVLGSRRDGITTEAEAQITLRYAATFDRLWAYISSNSVTGGTPTITLRENAADTALVLSITATGEFEDVANTNAVVSGDEVNTAHARVGSAGSFVAQGGTVRHDQARIHVANNQGDWTVTASALYAALGQQHVIADTSETDKKLQARSTETAANAFCYVTANTGTLGRVMALRVNAATSALSASITALTTGVFEDTSNTVALVATDDINLIQTGSAVGSVTVRLSAIELPTAVVGGSSAVKDLISMGIVPFARA